MNSTFQKQVSDNYLISQNYTWDREHFFSREYLILGFGAGFRHEAIDLLDSFRDLIADDPDGGMAIWPEITYGIIENGRFV